MGDSELQINISSPLAGCASCKLIYIQPVIFRGASSFLAVIRAFSSPDNGGGLAVRGTASKNERMEDCIVFRGEGKITTSTRLQQQQDKTTYNNKHKTTPTTNNNNNNIPNHNKRPTGWRESNIRAVAELQIIYFGRSGELHKMAQSCKFIYILRSLQKLQIEPELQIQCRAGYYEHHIMLWPFGAIMIML